MEVPTATRNRLGEIEDRRGRLLYNVTLGTVAAAANTTAAVFNSSVAAAAAADAALRMFSRKDKEEEGKAGFTDMSKDRLRDSALYVTARDHATYPLTFLTYLYLTCGKTMPVKNVKL